MSRKLVELAKQDMVDGNISAARARLTPEARMDNPEALRLMGQTYDPRWLIAHGAVMQFDAMKASQFYVSAKNLGDEEAARILDGGTKNEACR